MPQDDQLFDLITHQGGQLLFAVFAIKGQIRHLDDAANHPFTPGQPCFKTWLFFSSKAMRSSSSVFSLWIAIFAIALIRAEPSRIVISPLAM